MEFWQLQSWQLLEEPRKLEAESEVAEDEFNICGVIRERSRWKSEDGGLPDGGFGGDFAGRPLVRDFWTGFW